MILDSQIEKSISIPKGEDDGDEDDCERGDIDHFEA
jgi:hypothetical protein